MGTVWLASDTVLLREVAVKEVTFPFHLSPEERSQLRERTLREARAAARFEHAHAIAVHDVVEEDGKPWIVMEYVPSRSLSQQIREQGPLSPQQTARVGLDLIGVLQAAHRAGIVHRDVKPGNVLLGETDQAWLTDFGIATSSGDSALTAEGVLLGSPSFMAPERARGEEPGPASDLWSLGATLYSAVEGRPSFDRGEPMATLLAVVSDEPAPFRASGPLEPLLRALLAKEPERRPSAAQVIEALRPIARGAPATADDRPVHRPEPDRAGSERGDAIERLDRTVMRALGTTTGAATRAAAKAAAHTAAVKLEEMGAHATRSPGERAPEPASATPAPARGRRAERKASDERPRWRFKRRWIGIPLAVALLLLLGVLVVAGLVVWAIVHSLPAGAAFVLPLVPVAVGQRRLPPAHRRGP